MQAKLELRDGAGKKVTPGAPIYHKNAGYMGHFAGLCIDPLDGVSVLVRIHDTEGDEELYQPARAAEWTTREPAARPKITTDEYFGGCPRCGRSSGSVNVRSVHFGICGEHKLYWLIGSNLFSCWRDEIEADWNRNAALLDSYTEVEPIHPDPGDALSVEFYRSERASITADKAGENIIELDNELPL